MKLSYQLWQAKQSEKAKVVLLHGMGGTGALWRPIAAGLEDEFSILAPDQRGHGKSQIPHTPGSRVPPQYTPLDYGRDLVETLEAIPFYPAYVVGHSMGVRTACALGHLKPKWVKGLVLVDLGILPMHFSTRAEARAFMEQNCPDPSIAQYLMAVSQPTADGGVTFPFDQAALIETIHAARDVSVRTWVKELGESGKKILVLRGANSKVWTRDEFLAEQDRYKTLRSVRFAEIPNAGHGLPFEQRPLFVQELKAFCT
jgi:pimeloyl-ACP methyl ester carboxylesterase